MQSWARWGGVKIDCPPGSVVFMRSYAIWGAESLESRLGMEVLMWVSRSERPLQADELCHASGAERGSTDLSGPRLLRLKRPHPPSALFTLLCKSICLGINHNHNVFRSPHSMIAEICLTYLNFQRVKNLSPTLDRARETTPFLEYASCY